MKDAALAAAQKLVSNLHLPPQSHAVWLQTNTNAHKEFEYTICVSKHPRYPGPMTIPAEVDGFKTKIVDWPDLLGG